MMAAGHAARDVLTYLFVMTLALCVPTFAPHAAYACLVPALGAAVFNTRKLESSWLNFFEIGKLLGGFLAVASLGLMQLRIITFDRDILYGVLMFNIAEAVVTDVSKHGLRGIPNAASGLLVMLSMPKSVSSMESVEDSGILHLNTPWTWIALYTIWNAVFAFSFGYSLTTRMVLLPPILIGAVGGMDSSLWIVPRAWSLLMNMGMRATQALWIFRPGMSIMTKPQGSPGPSDDSILFSGLVSLAIVSSTLISTA